MCVCFGQSTAHSAYSHWSVMDSMHLLSRPSCRYVHHAGCTLRPFSSTSKTQRRFYRSPAAAKDPSRCTSDSVKFIQNVLCVSTSTAAAMALLLGAPAIAFGPVSVKLDGIQANKVPCGAGVATVSGVTFSGSSQKAACLSVTASATNPSGKPLYNADVFGRVYDVNGEAAIDDTENIRIAYIDEIPPGTSQVSFKLFVPQEQYDLGPLSLQGFKATGFPGKMLPNQGSGLITDQDQEVCEITGDCEDLAAEAAIK